MTNVRWQIITMLLVAATINYTDRVNLQTDPRCRDVSKYGCMGTVSLIWKLY